MSVKQDFQNGKKSTGQDMKCHISDVTLVLRCFVVYYYILFFMISVVYIFYPVILVLVITFY